MSQWSPRLRENNMKHFEMVSDVMTTTRKAARDLREMLAIRLGADSNSKVRMIALVLVNGFREPKSCNRLIVDEALISHFGAIVMAQPLRVAIDSTKHAGVGHNKNNLYLQEPDGCGVCP
ncbi:hypothetical protein EVAR_13722_1 [Eumeta japonica]|uniref:Uncharacterized protein n=1 Tax=Eumeta variegata TaxID=151549 RepID=A0A4C1UBF2_EUMVA|nr:hypothetical protein EVAR_13722_1 [Eumeta japonica]